MQQCYTIVPEQQCREMMLFNDATHNAILLNKAIRTKDAAIMTQRRHEETAVIESDKVVLFSAIQWIVS